jgi:hypothetical protein
VVKAIVSFLSELRVTETGHSLMVNYVVETPSEEIYGGSLGNQVYVEFVDFSSALSLKETIRDAIVANALELNAALVIDEVMFQDFSTLAVT